MACVVSVEKKGNSYGEIRLVEGNQKLQQEYCHPQSSEKQTYAKNYQGNVVYDEKKNSPQYYRRFFPDAESTLKSGF